MSVYVCVCASAVIDAVWLQLILFICQMVGERVNQLCSLLFYISPSLLLWQLLLLSFFLSLQHHSHSHLFLLTFSSIFVPRLIIFLFHHYIYLYVFCLFSARTSRKFDSGASEIGLGSLTFKHTLNEELTFDSSERLLSVMSFLNHFRKPTLAQIWLTISPNGAAVLTQKSRTQPSE